MVVLLLDKYFQNPSKYLLFTSTKSLEKNRVPGASQMLTTDAIFQIPCCWYIHVGLNEHVQNYLFKRLAWIYSWNIFMQKGVCFLASLMSLISWEQFCCPQLKIFIEQFNTYMLFPFGERESAENKCRVRNNKSKKIKAGDERKKEMLWLSLFEHQSLYLPITFCPCKLSLLPSLLPIFLLISRLLLHTRNSLFYLRKYFILFIKINERCVPSHA